MRVLALLLALCALAFGSVAEPQALSRPAAAQAQPSSTTVAVLGYGRFSSDATATDAMTAPVFRRQMEFLKKRGLTPLSAEDYVAWRRGEKALPPHAVLVTLDEADRDVYTVAYPILRELGIPFIIFVDNRSFEPGSPCLQLKQLQEMTEHGAAIGCHSASRPANYEWQFAGLTGEKEALIEKEFGQPAERLRRLFGACTVLSYPRGYVDESVPAKLKDFGYELAFDCTPSKNSARTAPFRQHRYMIAQDESFARALNFGKESDTGAILRQLHGRETVAAEPAFVPRSTTVFEDDDVAEEIEEEEPAAVPTVAGLTKRTPDGDWVTAQFAAPLVPREQTRVAVLGYHNFSNTKKVSEMRMRTSEFCTQMQYIRDAGLSVITMEDFLEWLRGDRQLPERCVLITIDDGWKSVYTDAYPVLKAYGYPFTLFLYTKYIDVHGDSMTQAQIREMMGAGATIGSHSTSHYYPKSWKRYAQTSEAYSRQVQTEILDSCTKLKELFGNCSAYCYPGGYNTPPMLAALETSAFRAAFTVVPAKITCEENPYLIHRYMVFGVDPSIFRHAMNFGTTADAAAVQEGIRAAEAPARAFFPQAFEGLAPATSASAVPQI